MKDKYSYFIEEKENIYKNLQDEFEIALKKTRDSDKAINTLQGYFTSQYHKTREKLRVAGYDDFFFEHFEETFNMDVNLTKSEAFILAHKKYKTEPTDENIILLATKEALNDFLQYIRRKHDNLNKLDKMSQNNYWIGKESTEFVQLIYALVETGRLQNKNKKEMIEDIARFMGHKLTKDWQSNLSKSIHHRNNDYEPNIFKELKDGWINYADDQREKENKYK